MAAQRTPKSYQILQKAFQSKKKLNPAYSQRALARDLGISAVFVTKILTGKKPFPARRFKKLFQVLNLDPAMQAIYTRASILESLPSPELRSMAQTVLARSEAIETYQQVSSEKFGVLKQWFNVAILCFLTFENKPKAPTDIAKYFGLDQKQVLESLEQMSAAGLVEFRDGVWSRIDDHSYFPTTKSKEDVRAYHRQMIQRAYNELSLTSNEAFENRLITGFSIATNVENLPLAKQKISAFLADLSHLLSEGPCDEVFQCNVQLFPLKAKKGFR